MTVVRLDYRRAPTPTCQRVARWETARQLTRQPPTTHLSEALPTERRRLQMLHPLSTEPWRPNLFVTNTVIGDLFSLQLLRRVANWVLNISQGVLIKIVGLE